MSKEEKNVPLRTKQADMEKVQKFPLAEFLGFTISAKKCVIFKMYKALEKCGK